MRLRRCGQAAGPGWLGRFAALPGWLGRLAALRWAAWRACVNETSMKSNQPSAWLTCGTRRGHVRDASSRGGRAGSCVPLASHTVSEVPSTQMKPCGAARTALEERTARGEVR